MARCPPRLALRAVRTPKQDVQHAYQKASISSQARVHSRAQEDTLAQRDLFVDILSTNATRRDAKQFLARLKQQKAPPLKAINRRCNGVNLGSLYAPARAIAETPQFVRDHVDRNEVTSTGEIHIAMLSLRDPSSLDDHTLEGLAMTIAQLVKLDMRILLVLGNAHASASERDLLVEKDAILRQALRLARAIDSHSAQGARLVADALIQSEFKEELELVSRKLVLEPLSQGIVTIIPALAYSKNWKMQSVDLSDVVKALTRLATTTSNNCAMQLDRIVLLEKLGGIPSRVRGDKAHVFINLEQEYEDIEAELGDMEDIPGVDTHVENLRMLQDVLSLLPHSSSAIIITPDEAAASSTRTDDTHSIGTGTRKQKNTLIHNLLTNKPIVSSSLPTARLTANSTVTARTPTATLVKKGMPLTIIPGIERDILGWQAPDSGKTSLDLDNDPRVDLPRLVHLINDSFRRELDTENYLKRISGRVAGLIVAGNYEGGAILTWEDPTTTGLSDPARLVPYLDKFAVLQSSQGSAGVADIVFQAMVRTCFPQGVCWRSRSNNPVNKWYFERATGSWSLPQTQWTMFWTGDGVVDDQTRWNDYVTVCKGVVPTWKDTKPPD